jgi:hypothetical protein
MKKTIIALLIVSPLFLSAQTMQAVPSTYWQQRVKYVMDIDMNVGNNRLNGKQTDYWKIAGYAGKGILSFILECVSAK